MRHHVLTLPIAIAGQERQVSITFTYVRGYPAVMYGDNAEPATGPEIEVQSAKIERQRVINHGVAVVYEPCPEWFLDILQDAIRSGDLSEDDFADVVNEQEK